MRKSIGSVQSFSDTRFACQRLPPALQSWPVLRSYFKSSFSRSLAPRNWSESQEVAFLHEMRRFVPLDRPMISMVKAYSGGFPVMQKSLSKLSERTTNACETIFINERNVPYKRILLIDDAVGSGATFNEFAKKLKTECKVSKVFGFAVVGSCNGFEVLPEV